jgi:hypothetical protein
LTADVVDSDESDFLAAPVSARYDAALHRVDLDDDAFGLRFLVPVACFVCHRVFRLSYQLYDL